MLNTKIYKLFVALGSTEQDLLELKRFIYAGLKEKEGQITKLFDFLRKYSKIPNHKNFNKEYLYKKLYRKPMPKSDGMLRALFFRFGRLLEDFMIHKFIKEQPIFRDLILGQSFQKLNLDKSFYNALLSGIENSLPLEEARRALVLSLVYKAIFYHAKTSMPDKKKYHNYLDLAQKHHLEYVTLENLKYSCEKLARHRFHGESLNDDFYNNFSNYLKEVKVDSIPLIHLLALASRFLNSPCIELYEQLKKQYFLHFDDIHSEKSYLLNCLLNGLIGLKHPDRYEEQFELQKIGIEKGLFIENGVIDSSHFNNIVRIFCKMEYCDLGEEFIETHLQYLNVTPKVLENIKVRAACQIAFAKRNFELVLKLKKDLTLSNYNYIIDKHIFGFKANYELSRTHLVLEGKRAFFDYLREKHDAKYIGDTYKSMFSNFYNLLALIIEYPYKDYSKQDLLETLESFGGLVAESKWLKEKIQELR